VDPVALCADVSAEWHAAWLASLGLRSERTATLWRALDPPPVIYWTAITLSRDARAEEVASLHGTICDAWSLLDLSTHGFEHRDREGFVERAREPWFVRPPGALAPEEPPPELEVVRVATPADVVEFEEVSVRGFGGEDARVEPGTFHPPAILRDERMTMLTGRVDGTAVAAATAYRTAAAVGVYGVTTVAAARGRGYASALTRALVDPRLPVLLSPSPEAERLYRRIGFEQVGELRQWQRAGASPPNS